MPGFNDVPFNFVPLNKKVYIPEWGDEISQDIPFSDGEDGIISFDIENLTPLFIKNDMEKESFSAHVMEKNGKKLYFLPATSLKGMLRSVLEILSFSRLRQFNNDSFGYRKVTNNAYRDKVNGGSCGWLKRELGKNGQYSYYIYECPSGVRPTKEERYTIQRMIEELRTNASKNIPADLVRRVTHALKDEKSIGKIVSTFVDIFQERYPKVSEDSCLVCTGAIPRKKTQYLFDLFDLCKENRIEVKPDAVERFLAAYRRMSPNDEFINKSLDEQKPLAVFFKKEDDEVSSIGISRNYRLPYRHSIKDGVHQVPTDGKDMVECIFGYTDDKALRGRVQVGNAFGTVCEDADLNLQNGVLGQPKASFYPYYLEDGKTYDSDDFSIAGRKRYRVHSNDNITPMPGGNGNDNVISTLKLLPAGNKFQCKIRIHNLRPAEVGAILSALTFHNTKGCYHTIGMGKAFGYGKLKISGIELTGLLHSDKLDYMKEFERVMNVFCKRELQCFWTKSEVFCKLCAIAADHSRHLEYMNLEEYTDCKENGVGNPELSENLTLEIKMAPYREEEKRIKTETEAFNPEELDKIGDKEELQSLNLSCLKLRKDCESLNQEIYPFENLELKNCKEKLDCICKHIHQCLERLKEEEQRHRAEREKTQLRENGLRNYLLNYGAVPKKFPSIKTRLKNWVNVNDRERLLLEEYPELQEALQSIFETLKAKDKRDWRNENKWIVLKEILDEAHIKEIYNHIINLQN